MKGLKVIEAENLLRESGIIITYRDNDTIRFKTIMDGIVYEPMLYLDNDMLVFDIICQFDCEPDDYIDIVVSLIHIRDTNPTVHLSMVDSRTSMVECHVDCNHIYDDGKLSIRYINYALGDAIALIEQIQELPIHNFKFI